MCSLPFAICRLTVSTQQSMNVPLWMLLALLAFPVTENSFQTKVTFTYYRFLVYWTHEVTLRADIWFDGTNRAHFWVMVDGERPGGPTVWVTYWWLPFDGTTSLKDMQFDFLNAGGQYNPQFKQEKSVPKCFAVLFYVEMEPPLASNRDSTSIYILKSSSYGIADLVVYNATYTRIHTH